MFCVKCGKQLSGNEKFCPKCGAKTADRTQEGNVPDNSRIGTDAGNPGNADSDKTEILGNSLPLIPPLSVNAENPEIYIPDIQGEKDKEKNKKEKNKEKRGLRKAVSLLALAAVIMVLVGVIVYMGRFFTGKEDEISFTGKLEKAEECMAQDDFEGAARYYLEALEMEPEEPDIYEGLAEAYQMDGQLGNAVKILETGYEVTENENLKNILEELKTVLKASDDGETDSREDVPEGEDGDTVPKEEEDAEDVYTGERQDVNIEIRQVDNTNFPEMVIYASITDEAGNTVKQLERSDFNIQEIDAQGNVGKADIEDVYQVLNEDKINVNLVLDASGSMNAYSKMLQAKNAASGFIHQMDLTGGDKVEIISFDDYVYLEQDFTNEEGFLENAINNITPNGGTALFDALYAGLFQTYYEEGAKCVIGFTDGEENASSYSFDDVVSMARNTGIPVFIIGIGDGYDTTLLQDLAAQCSGRYYSAEDSDLQTILEDIYLSIYREQQDYYVFKYTSQNLENPNQFRELVLETSKSTEFYGSYRKAYIPQADLSGAFSSEYMNKDYILDFSSQREVNDADLAGLSLAELRIARNEIFARHGRQFKDIMLNQWFYSKIWYLNIGAKYAPDEFDAIWPSPLSKLELQNIEFIKNYEVNSMNTQDIYPNAAHTLLSDYDMALSKAVLRTALAQIQNYASTDILEQNKRLLQEAINKEDVQY